MFVMAKKIELFASTLNGIAASVRCVSSKIVVLIGSVNCGTPEQKSRCQTEKLDKSAVFCSSKHKWFNFYLNLGCARGNESIIYFPTI